MSVSALISTRASRRAVSMTTWSVAVRSPTSRAMVTSWPAARSGAATLGDRFSSSKNLMPRGVTAVSFTHRRSGVAQRLGNIVGFEIREVVEYLRHGHPVSDHGHHGGNRHAQTPDDGQATYDVRG